MDFWLIQRCIFKSTKDRDLTGIDALLTYDYMGSAEFEFGALGDSLKAVCGKLDEYQHFSTKLHARNGKALDFFCLPEQHNDVLKFLQDEVKERHRLKERMKLQDAMTGDVETNCWWDVGNHWFAYLGQANEQRLLKALQASAQNLRAKGKIK